MPVKSKIPPLSLSLLRPQSRVRGLGIALAVGLAGCGYTLQGSHSALLEREQVRRIYVRPLVNNTYKTGVQNVVYNALIRTLLVHRRVKLADSLEDADAVLDGAVSNADLAPIAAGRLGPTDLFPNDGLAISTIYNATLTCTFSLSRVEPKVQVMAGPFAPRKARVFGPLPQPTGTPELHFRKGMLWGSTFSRAKPFLSANQLDVPGTTSALINESEFDRALADLATLMMDDLHESMLAMF